MRLMYRTNSRPRNDLDLDGFPAVNKRYGTKLERLRALRSAVLEIRKSRLEKSSESCSKNCWRGKN